MLRPVEKISFSISSRITEAGSESVERANSARKSAQRLIDDLVSQSRQGFPALTASLDNYKFTIEEAEADLKFQLNLEAVSGLSKDVTKMIKASIDQGVPVKAISDNLNVDLEIVETIERKVLLDTADEVCREGAEYGKTIPMVFGANLLFARRFPILAVAKATTLEVEDAVRLKRVIYETGEYMS